MNITLEQIRNANPCNKGWIKLLKNLGRKTGKVSFKEILESNGIEDAVWCLKVLDYRDYCLFNVEVAEYILPIFENSYPTSKEPKKAIDAVKKWYRGEINESLLHTTHTSALEWYKSVDDTGSACFSLAYAAISVYSSSYTVCTSVVLVSEDASDKIEELFIKYFCNEGVKNESSIIE